MPNKSHRTRASPVLLTIPTSSKNPFPPRLKKRNRTIRTHNPKTERKEKRGGKSRRSPSLRPLPPHNLPALSCPSPSVYFLPCVCVDAAGVVDNNINKTKKQRDGFRAYMRVPLALHEPLAMLCPTRQASDQQPKSRKSGFPSSCKYNGYRWKKQNNVVDWRPPGRR